MAGVAQDLAQVRVDAVPPHGASLDRVVKVANAGALFGVIRDHLHLREEGRPRSRRPSRREGSLRGSQDELSVKALASVKPWRRSRTGPRLR